MIQFVQPLALWALAGLSIPIAIHFLSRKEGKVIRIGSIRHLEETTTQKFKGIRLNEILLLLLRCLCIVVFTLILAGLQFLTSNNGSKRWLLLEKGLEDDARVNTLRDSLDKQGFEIRFLSLGFPTLDKPADEKSSYYQLINDLAQQDLEKVVVVSYNKSHRFRGEPSALPGTVQWISLPAAPSEFEVNTWITSLDSLYTRQGYSKEEVTYFETTRRKVSLEEIASLTPERSKQVAIVSDAEHEADVQLVEASLRSLRDYQHVELEFLSYRTSELAKLPSDLEFLFWLSDESMPESLNYKIIHLKPDESIDLIKQESPTQWRITKRLHPEIALKENFTVNFASLLLASPALEQLVQENDVRLLPDSIAWLPTQSENHRTFLGAFRPADSYLFYLLLVLLIIERLLAYQRKQ